MTYLETIKESQCGWNQNWHLLLLQRVWGKCR